KQKIETYHPKIVCFVGKGVYQQYSGKKVLPWGRQSESVVPGTVDFVAPSSSGLVRMRMDEVVGIYEKIPPLIKKLNHL
ncbi:MAG TPA: mismatch-specific DNA-glycosylase, partial [Bacillus bacterium]|nr:mismatch-specific DNA-glycosylase [Bacillus sp. (in: firmicutes)]